MEELDEEIKSIKKLIKKKEETEKKKKEKNELRMKEQFIKSQEVVTDDQGTEFDQNLFDFIRNNNINIEELAYQDPDKKIIIPEQQVDEEFNLSDASESDYIDMMEQDIEENMRLYNERKANTKKEKKEKKKKKFEEAENNENEDNERKKKNNDGIEYVPKNDDDMDVDDYLGDEEDEEMEKDEDMEDDDIIDNPLRNNRKKVKEEKKEEKVNEGIFF
jgi:hypothetical protein